MSKRPTHQTKKHRQRGGSRGLCVCRHQQARHDIRLDGDVTTQPCTLCSCRDMAPRDDYKR